MGKIGKFFQKKDRNGRHDIITTFLCPDTVIEGIIEFEGTIRLDGKVKGDIRSKGEGKGTVIVGETAVIEAELKVEAAIIMGVVRGCISAKKKIEIYPPGKVDGDMEAPIISIASGAVFNGKCFTVPKSMPFKEIEQKETKLIVDKAVDQDVRKDI